jgi:Fur family peroxide stress response transcriptional regulator
MITDKKRQMLRKSRQREKILELLRSTDRHPTAEQIYSMLKPEMKSLSLGTVYRNLNVLVGQGLAKKLEFGSSFDRYDAVVSNHYHLYAKNAALCMIFPWKQIQAL